jgi:hypothetical protein
MAFSTLRLFWLVKNPAISSWPPRVRERFRGRSTIDLSLSDRCIHLSVFPRTWPARQTSPDGTGRKLPIFPLHAKALGPRHDKSIVEYSEIAIIYRSQGACGTRLHCLHLAIVESR